MTMVGLDIHCPDGQPVELNQRVLRGIPISYVRDATRKRSAAVAQDQAKRLTQLAQAGGTLPSELLAGEASYFADLATAYTAKGEPRRRLPTISPGLLDEVARLYLSAVNKDGDKTPAKTVEEALRAAGTPVRGRDQVRKWIQRAREAGLIPPTTERK